jgi:hypothetical protein
MYSCTVLMHCTYTLYAYTTLIGGVTMMDGVCPVSVTRDTLGPMARSVRDVALLHAVMMGDGSTDGSPTGSSTAPLVAEPVLLSTTSHHFHHFPSLSIAFHHFLQPAVVTVFHSPHLQPALTPGLSAYSLLALVHTHSSPSRTLTPLLHTHPFLSQRCALTGRQPLARPAAGRAFILLGGGRSPSDGACGGRTRARQA